MLFFWVVVIERCTCIVDIVMVFCERKFDAGACPQGHPESNQGQGDQDQGSLNGQI